jgi:hypothetical protein
LLSSRATGLLSFDNALLFFLQDAVLEVTSDSKLSKYFRSVFKQISQENPLPVKFAARCLQKSSSCWEVWSGLGPSSPPSTALLLKELQPVPPPLPVDQLASTLRKVAQRLPEVEKEMAKVTVCCAWECTSYCTMASPTYKPVQCKLDPQWDIRGVTEC